MKSKWSLVVHCATQTTINIWVGTLFPDLRKPDECLVRISDELENEVSSYTIASKDWQRPFKKVNDRFYAYIPFHNLNANTYYTVEFIRQEQDLGYKKLPQQVLSKGAFKTLPNALSPDQPFVVALGSCFYNEGDNGAVSTAYNSLYFNGAKNHKPDVKFLTGDQVYLDIGLDSLSPITKDIRKRIADDYANTWQTQRKMLRHGATWFLADDHEYWNNYPYTSGKNPYLWMITAFKGIKKAWAEAAICGVKNVQKISLLKKFNLGNDLSVCFADLRSERDNGKDPKKMISSSVFDQLIDWAETLSSPGVIVLPQPLLVKPGGDLDLNLANYPMQYNKFIQALATSGHDIMCLTGDVHFGRIAKVEFGTKGAILHEIIASPMSNLTGLDGKVAASSPTKLKRFPMANISGVPIKNVQYAKKWFVTTERVKYLRFFSYKKTKEHFMTLAFTKTPENKVAVEIQAWRIREVNKRTRLPKQDFREPYKVIMT